MRTKQKWVGIIVVLAVLLFASAGVGQARGGGHGFGGHGFDGHGFHHGFHRFGGPRVGIGLGLGVEPFWGAYPYPPVVVAPPPVVAQPSPEYWYYCSNPEGYYPYVQQCPGGWQQVPPPPS